MSILKEIIEGKCQNKRVTLGLRAKLHPQLDIPGSLMLYDDDSRWLCAQPNPWVTYALFEVPNPQNPLPLQVTCQMLQHLKLPHPIPCIFQVPLL